MSITAIESTEDEFIDTTLTFTSDEDDEFDRVYQEILGAEATSVTARKLFDAGVNFVRDSEKVDSITDKTGAHQLIVVNPAMLPAWMFRDALLTYTARLHEEFTMKHSNGDMNTQNLFDCVKSLEHIINTAIPVDSAIKPRSILALEKTKKKCETILNDVI